MKIIKYKSLFVFSNRDSLFFYESFGDGINIISGRNTSGKSTLIQSLLFSFGINDVKQGLSEILESKPIFRLDFSLATNTNESSYTIVRDDEHLFIREPDGKTRVFNGISTNNNREHIDLKSYLNDIFGFSLKLEQKGEFKTAPIESAFLPYYVSQSVGWVYLRESFSNFTYYKNFKFDFLDYYLGITGSLDREKLIKLELQKKELQVKIKNLEKHIEQPEFKIAQLLDEKFGEKATEYIQGYVDSKKEEVTKKIKLTKDAEALSIFEQHKKIVSSTIREINRQKPDGVDKCPACRQVLPRSLNALYEHYQKKHDSEELKVHLDEQIKSAKSKLNTTQANVRQLNEKNREQFEVLEQINIEGTTLESWLEGKATLQLQIKLENDLRDLKTSLSKIEDDINELLGNKDLEAALELQRKNKADKFKRKFEASLKALGVKALTEDRYLDIYKINSFPYQGVELHKTMLAYHFNFNSIISGVENIHRLPFLLDGVLKEDIDQNNFEKLFTFISQEAPQDTQTFISISDFTPSNEAENENQSRKSVKEIIEEYFNSKPKHIMIGDGRKERSFLSKPLDNSLELYQDTCRIIEMS